MPDIGRPLRQGDSFETLIRALVVRAPSRTIGEEEAWVRKRLDAFRAPEPESVCIRYDDRIVQVRQIKTDDGSRLLIVTDITEARRAENSLRTYVSAIDQVTDRISIIGSDYRYLFVNDASARFHGRPRSEFIGRHLADFVGEAYFHTTSKADIDRCLAGERFSTQRFCVSQSGDPLHYDLTLEPFRDDEGAIVGAIIVFRDITEETLRTEELHLARSAIDQISERVVIFDRDQKIRLINKRNLDYYERAAGHALGEHIGDLLGPGHL